MGSRRLYEASRGSRARRGSDEVGVCLREDVNRADARRGRGRMVQVGIAAEIDWL